MSTKNHPHETKAHAHTHEAKAHARETKTEETRAEKPSGRQMTSTETADISEEEFRRLKLIS